MKNSRIKRFIERHKEIIINEAKLKISLNIEFEMYIGSSLGKSYYLVITKSYIFRIKDEYGWYILGDYDWIKNLKNAVKS
jgi:hypothetical protein